MHFHWKQLAFPVFSAAGLVLHVSVNAHPCVQYVRAGLFMNPPLYKSSARMPLRVCVRALCVRNGVRMHQGEHVLALLPI